LKRRKSLGKQAAMLFDAVFDHLRAMAHDSDVSVHALDHGWH
jgi:hypothetical protein